ncbi:hypothetical protein [Neptuniibacter sp. QD37_11]|uniref:hypothetical protein n=1 Tax=Neptuniibacter sp. QD37_11 TaxID=3398209 RepID=UPI0039F610E3
MNANNLFPTKPVTSFVDHASKYCALNELCANGASADGVQDDYEFVMGLQEDDDLPCDVNRDFDNLPMEDLQANVKGIKDSVADLLKLQNSLIKRGAELLTLDANIDSNVRNWDMNHLATLGMNTQIDQVVGGHRYEFRIDECLWVSATGPDLRYDYETGLPVPK